jgi:hypothetical protein
VRERLKARGELGQEEVVHQAIDQRGETYDMPISTGDKVRLFRKTYALIEGKPGFIGANGNIVEVVGQSVDGLQLRDADGRVGSVQWRALKDSRSDRLLLGFGHALTIDSAQGITSGEHINALPRGTAGITAFKSYVAESRHVTQVYTVISEAAVFEAVKRGRAVGDKEAITTGHLWEQAAKDMSDKPYKSLALDLVEAIERRREEEVDRFIRTEHRVFAQRAAGRDHAGELRKRRRDAEVRAVLAKHIVPLVTAVERREAAIRELAEAVTAFPDIMRAKVRAAVVAANERREVELAKAAQASIPGFSPGL